ncbi:hypothetical protein GCM10027517_32230 [Phycicoccus ginsengisoli]
MSRSQVVLRVVLGAASVALAAVTAVAAVSPLWVAVLLLVAFTAYAAVRPGTHAVTVLLGGHVLHWLATVPTPVGGSAWLLTVVAALLGLLVHTSAALAAAYPDGAPVPPAALRRWSRRAALVVAACVPVWAVTGVVSGSGTPGEGTLTYAAIIGTALLALAVWLVAREPQH